MLCVHQGPAPMSLATTAGGWGPLPGPPLQTQTCRGRRPSTPLRRARRLGWARAPRGNHTCAGRHSHVA